MKENNKFKSADIFFNDITFREAVAEVKRLSREPQFSFVVTPNVDHLARLVTEDKSKELRPIYHRAALSLCDSRILDKLLGFKGRKIKEVIPGSTLTQYLFNEVLTEEDRILVVGVEDVYIETLRNLYPDLNIQHINPSMGFINKEQEVVSLIEQIRQIGAHYVFLSVGSPRQEILADKIAASESIGGVGLCVGASVLFIVGAEKRAPLLLQKLRLEWAYRITRDPSRLAMRYFKNFLALPAIFKSL